MNIDPFDPETEEDKVAKAEQDELEKLEQDFIALFNEVNPKIQEKLAAASKLIAEATAISEENGIPFRPKNRIMFCNPSYIPKSVNEKHPKIDHDLIGDITNAYGDYHYKGWQSSQVC